MFAYRQLFKQRPNLQRSFVSRIERDAHKPQRRLASSYSRRPNRPEPIPLYIWAGLGTGGLVLGFTYYSGINYSPLTNRRRWIATTPTWEQRMGDEEYRNLVRQWKGKILPSNHRASVTLRRVGNRLSKAANQFARDHNLESTVCSKPFTFTVVRSETANAFVLPGNHVFVMTGLFQFVRDEDDLAAVVGHELAHTLARHTGERISGSVVANLIAALSLTVDSSGTIARLLLPAMSVLRELPNSRQQETEADQIGLHLAAHACYDPRAAHRVFSAMKDAMDGSSSGPEFLSTHPSHASRLHDLEGFIPVAMKTVDQNSEECRVVRRKMKEARLADAELASSRK